MIVRTRLRPLAGSNAGLRAKPLSMTIDTPSTVTLDSAISVETMTRRRDPERKARSCSAADSVPWRGRTSTSSRSASARIVALISPTPGEEDEDIPGVVLERMTHCCGDTVFQTGVRSQRHPPQINRERPSPARHDRGIAEEDRDGARVESRGHDEDA